MALVHECWWEANVTCTLRPGAWLDNNHHFVAYCCQENKHKKWNTQKKKKKNSANMWKIVLTSFSSSWMRQCLIFKKTWSNMPDISSKCSLHLILCDSLCWMDENKIEKERTKHFYTCSMCMKKKSCIFMKLSFSGQIRWLGMSVINSQPLHVWASCNDTFNPSHHLV